MTRKLTITYDRSDGQIHLIENTEHGGSHEWWTSPVVAMGQLGSEFHSPRLTDAVVTALQLGPITSITLEAP